VKKIRELELLYIIIIVLCGIFIVANFISAFSPITGTDTLTARMNNPKRYVQNSGFVSLPYSLASNMSLGVEMLYVIAILINWDIFANLIAVFISILLIYSIFCFGNKYFGARVGILTVALIISTNTFYSYSSLPFQDFIAALFLLLSLNATLDYYNNDDFRLLILMGIFAGAAASVKLNSGIFIICLFLSLGYILTIKKRNIFLLLFPLLTAFVIYLPWMIKSFVITGDPFYPMFTKLFPLKYPHNIFLINDLAGASFYLDIKKILIYPFEVSFNPRIYGGFLGPTIILAFISAIFYRFWRNRVLLLLFIFSAIVYIFHFLTLGGFPPIPRYIFISIIFVALIASWGIEEIHNINLKKILVGFLMGWLLFFTMFTIYKKVDNYRYIFGNLSKNEFLEKVNGGFKQINTFEYLNKTVPRQKKVLLFDLRAYYLEANYVLAQRLEQELNFAGIDNDDCIFEYLLEKNITYVYYQLYDSETEIFINNTHIKLFEVFRRMVDKGYFQEIYHDDKSKSFIYEIKSREY